MMKKMKILKPTSPEGKYWFDRHCMLIEVFKSFSNSNNECLQSVATQVLDTEMQLDMTHIKIMKEKVIGNENNLIVVDSFKN